MHGLNITINNLRHSKITSPLTSIKSKSCFLHNPKHITSFCQHIWTKPKLRWGGICEGLILCISKKNLDVFTKKKFKLVFFLGKHSFMHKPVFVEWFSRKLILFYHSFWETWVLVLTGEISMSMNDGLAACGLHTV